MCILCVCVIISERSFEPFLRLDCFVGLLFVCLVKKRKEKRVEAGQGGRADNDKGAEKDAVHQVV